MGKHTAQSENVRDQALLRMLAAIALVVIVFVVYAVIFKPFSGTGNDGHDSGSAGLIVGDVPALPASETYVGVVLEGDAAIAEVVSRHGLAGAIATGDGTYVLGVAEGDTDKVIDDLMKDPAVRDAGRVFESGE